MDIKAIYGSGYLLINYCGVKVLFELVIQVYFKYHPKYINQ